MGAGTLSSRVHKQNPHVLSSAPISIPSTRNRIPGEPVAEPCGDPRDDGGVSRQSCREQEKAAGAEREVPGAGGKAGPRVLSQRRWQARSTAPLVASRAVCGKPLDVACCPSQARPDSASRVPVFCLCYCWRWHCWRRRLTAPRCRTSRSRTFATGTGSPLREQERLAV